MIKEDTESLETKKRDHFMIKYEIDKLMGTIREVLKDRSEVSNEESA